MFTFCPREGIHEPYEESSRTKSTQVKSNRNTISQYWSLSFLERISKDSSSLILMVSAFLLLLTIPSIVPIMCCYVSQCWRFPHWENVPGQWFSLFILNFKFFLSYWIDCHGRHFHCDILCLLYKPFKGVLFYTLHIQVFYYKSGRITFSFHKW